MKALKSLLLAAVLLVSGCATCQQHPVACTVAGAIVTGSVVATIEQHHDHHAEQATPGASLPFVHPIGH